MDTPDHLHLSLAFPGLPELGELAKDFASHALRLAPLHRRFRLLPQLLAAEARVGARLERVCV